MRGTRAAIAVLVAVGGVAACTESALAGTFPGTNGLIAFTGTFGGPERDIFTITPDGQDLVRLTDNPAADFNPSWSGDGERIAFQSFRDGDPEIFAMDANGENETQLTFNSVLDQSPTFSPDGQRIAFVRTVGSDNEIFVMNADGSNPTPLTDNSDQDFTPSFSPDGSRIAFAREAGGGDGEIFVMNADGSNEVRLTDNFAEEGDPTWSPDQLRIVYVRDAEANGGIFVMDADGQKQTPLTSNSLIDLNPEFSPDGQRIVFSRGGASGDIWTMDADSQNQVPLTSDPGDDSDPAWQPLNPPRCDLSGASKQKSPKQVSASLTCPENATVTVSGELKAPKVPKLGGTESKSKTVTLQPLTLQIAPNTPTPVSLAPDKKGKKLLKKALKAGKKPKGTLTAVATDDLGASASDSFAVKLKRKKK